MTDIAPYTHPAIASAILKPCVSPANYFMVDNHRIFQGYYFWDCIGLDSTSREKFRGHEYFDHAEEFSAKYDQAGFDADYKSEPLEHYIGLINEFLAKRQS